MDNQQKWDFSVVDAAGLSQVEFAYVLDISRLTAHKYCTGKCVPQKHVAKKVSAALAALESFVARGVLPKQIAFRSEERDLFKEKLKQAVDRYVEKSLSAAATGTCPPQA